MDMVGTDMDTDTEMDMGDQRSLKSLIHYPTLCWTLPSSVQ
jgi:hypothetical protein